MAEPHNEQSASPNTAFAALSDDERSKVRTLMSAGSRESVGLAVSLLQTLEATPADNSAIFDHETLSQLVQSWSPKIWEEVFHHLPREQQRTFAAIALLRFIGSPERLRGVKNPFRRVWEWVNRWSAGCLWLRELFQAHHRGDFVEFHQDSAWVSLAFIDQLDDALVGEIVAFKGDVHLNEVTSITVKQARILARHDGWLYANGIASLDDDVADELARHSSHVFLEGLTTLSHVGLAEKLASKPQVYLDSLLDVTDSVAAALARSQNQIFAKQLAGRCADPRL